MNGLQSMPQRDVHAPAKRPAPRGAWNIGQQDLERVLVIRDTLSMFEDAPGALSRKDDTVHVVGGPCLHGHAEGWAPCARRRRGSPSSGRGLDSRPR